VAIQRETRQNCRPWRVLGRPSGLLGARPPASKAVAASSKAAQGTTAAGNGVGADRPGCSSPSSQRSEFLRDPGELVERCRGLPVAKEPHIVVVDEAQAVPGIFDAVQHLYDSDKRRWRFVLCGSSARKLRKTGANLLPGRTLLHHLYPLILPERPLPESGSLNFAVESPLPLSPVASTLEWPVFPATDLIERMTFGELPGVATGPPERRADLLKYRKRVSPTH